MDEKMTKEQNEKKNTSFAGETVKVSDEAEDVSAVISRQRKFFSSLGLRYAILSVAIAGAQLAVILLF